MEWWLARKLLRDDECMRLPEWEEDKFIYEDVAIVDNDDKFYYPTIDERRSSKWEIYKHPLSDVASKSDCELHYLVNYSVMSKIGYLRNRLNSGLIYFADKHNMSPLWGSKSGLKYHIAYSHISNDYIIEGTWGHDNIGCVYFSDKEVCKLALQQYRYLIDNIIHLNCLYGQLHNNKFDRNELEKLYNTYCL